MDKERQEMLGLLSEHISAGMSPLQVVEVHDKNDHTSGSLLLKMGAPGETSWANKRSVAIPR